MHMPPNTEVYMNLFIETPQQQARRLASASGALVAEDVHGLFSGVQRPVGKTGADGAQNNAAGATRDAGESQAAGPNGARVGDPGDAKAAGEVRNGEASRPRRRRARLGRKSRTCEATAGYAAAANVDGVTSGASAASCEAAVAAPAEPYSIAQEAYQQELDYDKKRVRGRRRKALLRVLLTIVLVPVLLFAAFIASYALTCVLNGATPEELVELMSKLFDQIRTYLAAIPSVSG